MRRIILAFATFVAIPLASQAASPFFVESANAIDIGTLGGREAVALDINNRGVIVGWSLTPSGISHAFYYEDGLMQDVGALFEVGSSVAKGINNDNEFVGGYFPDSGPSKAFRSNSPMQLLFLNDQSPEDELLGAQANAISDTGLVVGERSQHPTGYPVVKAVVWSDVFNFRHLNQLPGTLSPVFVYDINAAGEAVGRNIYRPATLRWNITPNQITETRIPVPVTGTFVYPDNDAYGINEHGSVVGDVWCNCDPDGSHQSRRHAMFWDGASDHSVDLGTPPNGRESLADDINDEDFIVGFAETLLFGNRRFYRQNAFLYHRDFGFYVLPDVPTSTGVRACRAFSLNERAGQFIQVVGQCQTFTGLRAVLWTVKVGQRIR